MPLYVPSSTVSSVSGSLAGLETFNLASSNYAQLDLTTNNPTYAGLVIAAYRGVVSKLMVYCLVSGSGTVQAAIYDGITRARLGITDTVSCSSTGLKTLTLTDPVTLTEGAPYFLAAGSTSNGSCFAAFNTTATSYSTQPYPSCTQISSRLPTTLNAFYTQYLLWIQAF